jgi:hypothetical protein
VFHPRVIEPRGSQLGLKRHIELDRGRSTPIATLCRAQPIGTLSHIGNPRFTVHAKWATTTNSVATVLVTAEVALDERSEVGAIAATILHAPALGASIGLEALAQRATMHPREIGPRVQLGQGAWEALALGGLAAGTGRRGIRARCGGWDYVREGLPIVRRRRSRLLSTAPASGDGEAPGRERLEQSKLKVLRLIHHDLDNEFGGSRVLIGLRLLDVPRPTFIHRFA